MQNYSVLSKNKKTVVALQRPMRSLAENKVKEILKKYNIPTTTFKVIEKEEDLDMLHLSFPLALKVCSPDILHKTDVGGVKLHIENTKVLLQVFRDFKKKFPNKKFLVEQMEKEGIEIIAGLVSDPTFGLAIMVGIGGIFTELYNDVSFRIVPITVEDALDMLDELKGKKIFENFRSIKIDKKALVELLINLSILGQAEKINQMDLNPIFLYERGLKVVDAKLILEV